MKKAYMKKCGRNKLKNEYQKSFSQEELQFLLVLKLKSNVGPIYAFKTDCKAVLNPLDF